MRFFVLILIVLSFFSKTKGQNILIKDNQGNPISNVHVFNEQYNTLSDENGNVIFLGVSHSEIFFQHISYKTISFECDELKQLNYIILLQEIPHKMCEVELVGRTGKEKKEVFQQLETLDLNDILLSQSQSTPDLLERHSGVFIQKSQMGGGSPIVRGFEANKLLLVMDGVRLNNAIYRSGHLHNILSIDNQSLEQIDLIFGPGSLNYGSDAIGGVIHFVSKEPKLNKRFLNYYSSFSTSNTGIKSYVDFNLSNDKLASLTSVSIGVYGDLRSGNRRDNNFEDFGKRLEYVSTENNHDKIVINKDPNLQIGTAYHQWNLSNKTKYLVSDKLSISSNIQYASSSNIPRYDQLTEYQDDQLKYAEWNYGPQERLFLSSTVDYYHDSKLFDRMKFILSFQKINEERIFRKYLSPIRISNIEDVDVWGGTIDFIKNIKSNHKLTYGIDAQQNIVNSTVKVVDIFERTQTSQALTRYPNDENTMLSLGLYTSYFIENLLKNVSTSFGVRYQYTDVNINFKKDNIIIWPESYYNGISNKNGALTWSASIKWQPLCSLGFSWMTATAFRSPNIDDMAKIRVKRDEISFVNLELTPEKSMNHELSVNIVPFLNKNTFLNLSIFQTNLKDAIVRLPFQFEGSNTYLQDGKELKIIANVNAAKATVKGVSINVNIDILNSIQLDGSITKIIGSTNIEDVFKGSSDIPLAHIPPAYGKLGLEYKKDKITCKLSYQFYDNKPVSEYGDSSDNLEYATIEGTPQYHLWHIQSAYQVYKNLSINLSLNNILDTHYRLFSSGISGTGRNLVVSVKGQI